MIYIWYTYITYVNVYVRILHRYIDIYICHPSLANWRSSALQLNSQGVVSNSGTLNIQNIREKIVVNDG